METNSGLVWGLNDESAHFPRNTSVPMIVKAKSFIIPSFLLDVKRADSFVGSRLYVSEKQPLLATSPAMYYTNKSGIVWVGEEVARRQWTIIIHKLARMVYHLLK